MFAWFGVNLLGVGLHSYGFESGVFMKFFIYIIVQVLVVVAALIAIRVKDSNARSAA